ncbi:MAG: hypothetical protein GC147_09280 [Porphyrobacter sp.]|nr:hypothetical protein [Porphyrobacter sp.]
MSLALPFALAALVPVMIGPLPATHRTLAASLCNGGTITIPLGDDKTPEDDGKCHPQGCHAGTCRERGKRRI